MLNLELLVRRNMSKGVPIDTLEPKPFQIPCKLGYEELIKKHNDLSIRVFRLNGIHNVTEKQEIITIDRDSDDYISHDESDSLNGDRHVNKERIVNTNEPLLDEEQLRVKSPTPSEPLVRSPTPSSDNSTTAKAEPQLSKTMTQTTKSVKRKQNGNKDPEWMIPSPVSKAPTNHTTRTKRTNESHPNKNNSSRLKQVKFACDPLIIDTREFIDDSFVCFLPEFCQRANIQPPPSDPLELCKKFKIVLPDCEIYKHDDEYDLENMEVDEDISGDYKSANGY